MSTAAAGRGRYERGRPEPAMRLAAAEKGTRVMDALDLELHLLLAHSCRIRALSELAALDDELLTGLLEDCHDQIHGLRPKLYDQDADP